MLGGKKGQESEGPVTKQGYSKARLDLTTGPDTMEIIIIVIAIT